MLCIPYPLGMVRIEAPEFRLDSDNMHLPDSQLLQCWRAHLVAVGAVPGGQLALSVAVAPPASALTAGMVRTAHRESLSAHLGPDLLKRRSKDHTGSEIQQLLASLHPTWTCMCLNADHSCLCIWAAPCVPQRLAARCRALRCGATTLLGQACLDVDAEALHAQTRARGKLSSFSACGRLMLDTLIYKNTHP